MKDPEVDTEGSKETQRYPEVATEGTGEALRDPEVGIEGTKETKGYPNVCTGGTEWALRGPKVDNDGIEEALRDPEITLFSRKNGLIYVIEIKLQKLIVYINWQCFEFACPWSEKHWNSHRIYKIYTHKFAACYEQVPETILKKYYSCEIFANYSTENVRCVYVEITF